LLLPPVLRRHSHTTAKHAAVNSQSLPSSFSLGKEATVPPAFTRHSRFRYVPRTDTSNGQKAPRAAGNTAVSPQRAQPPRCPHSFPLPAAPRPRAGHSRQREGQGRAGQGPSSSRGLGSGPWGGPRLLPPSPHLLLQLPHQHRLLLLRLLRSVQPTPQAGLAPRRLPRRHAPRPAPPRPPSSAARR